MVSAERFAASQGSFWASLLPRLEHFVRLSNMGPRRIAPPLRIDFSPTRQALVSETAFVRWSRSSGEDLFPLAGAEAEARERLSRLERSESLGDSLTPAEAMVADELAARLDRYSTTTHHFARRQYELALPGCGFISGGSPDLIAYDISRWPIPLAIVEIKSVARSFRSSDLRQIVCYVALYFAAYAELPDVMLVVNPLRGTAIEVSLVEFFDDVAGVMPSVALQELISEWSSTGISG